MNWNRINRLWQADTTMDAIAIVAKYLLEPWVARREGSNHLRLLAELEASQYFSGKELEQLQLERLHGLLNHAREHCPYYAMRFSECGFKSSQLTSLQDITNLPIIRKADIQEHRDEMKATNIADDQLVPNQTGGSTGAPLRFFLDRQRLFSRKAATMRHDRWAGWDIGAKIGVFWGNRVDFSNQDSLKSKFRSYLHDRRLILDTSDITLQKLTDFAQQLRAFRPPVYLAYANSMYLYARFLKEGKVRDYHRPRSIITSAELLTEEQRALIEEVFECKVFDRYGCRETSIIASECPKHRGLHVVAEHLLLEIVPDDLKGENDTGGKIIITDLLNYGMPLIRYQIEDKGYWVKNSCPCGRGLPMLRMAGGRTTDFLISPEGKAVSGASLTIYFIATVPGITQAQLVQKQLDLLIIRLVKGEQFDDDSIRAIQLKVREFFGDQMKHELEYVEHIPVEPSGKYRFSISELDPVEFLT